MIYPRCHFYSFYTKIDLSENFATEPTKLSEKKPQETELKNDKLSNNKIKGENEL
ncbi:hypothetical protein LMG9446_1974 [Lactococcus lactis subsp. lactis]|nr:hypothetical protein Li1_1302 [Lactococcus lactis subsp. lactis]KSU11795.1 hypothetical protein LMG9446_1974 [Lactococcus lactis subsp. lactis]